jgi:hypothetical protein
MPILIVTGSRLSQPRGSPIASAQILTTLSGDLCREEQLWGNTACVYQVHGSFQCGRKQAVIEDPSP